LTLSLQQAIDTAQVKVKCIIGRGSVKCIIVVIIIVIIIVVVLVIVVFIIVVGGCGGVGVVVLAAAAAAVVPALLLLCQVSWLKWGSGNNLILNVLKLLQRNGLAVVPVSFLPYFYIISIDQNIQVFWNVRLYHLYLVPEVLKVCK
jgi:hypothetical protein